MPNYEQRIFSPKLGVVPNLAYLTMLGSTELISDNGKEEIRSALTALEENLFNGSRSVKEVITKKSKFFIHYIDWTIYPYGHMSLCSAITILQQAPYVCIVSESRRLSDID